MNARAWSAVTTMLVSAGVVVGPPGTVDAATETVFAEHFTAPVGGLPPGWTGAGDVVTDRGYGPPGALRIADTATTAAVGAQALVAVSGEAHYELSVYSFTDSSGDGGQIRVVVEQYATASGTLDVLYGRRVVDVPVSSTWRQYRLTFTTAYRARRIRIGLFPAHGAGGYTGRAWFDELLLTSADPPANPVLDAAGRPVPVGQVENVSGALPADQFWARVPWAAATPDVGGRSLWSYDLLRRHYLATNLAIPRVTNAFYSTMAARDRTVGIRAPATCMPGGGPPPCDRDEQQVVAPADQRVVAEDIAYRPIASPHPYPTGEYTTEYYPRRMHDYLEQLGTEGDTSLLPAIVLTGGDPRFADLAHRLLDFLRYSQYGAGGENPFLRDEFPAAYAELRTAGLAERWQGGWPSVFNWPWLDGNGYTWRPHEPDHHVNADLARALVRAYEVTGERTYLDAAAAFVHHQVPRYGWHTGVWNGKRYYWTEYNPGAARLDAVDNVQALVARAAAMVGYYTGDRRLLEYARGLLWYCLREFAADGRWFYDGGENPMNQRAAVSHDMAVLLPLLGTVPYLLAAGVGMDAELDRLTTAYDYYRERFLDPEGNVPAPFHRIRSGQAVKPAPRRVDGGWQVTSFFTANDAGDGLVITDTPPSFAPALPTPSTLEMRVARLVPPALSGGAWGVGTELRFTVTPAELHAGLATGLRVQPGDAIRVSYTLPGPSGAGWTAVNTGTFGYRNGPSTTTVVPNTAFPTVVDGDNVPDIAAALAFPRPGLRVGEIRSTR